MVQKISLLIISIVILYGVNTAFAQPLAQGLRILPQPLAAADTDSEQVVPEASDAPLLATDIRITITGNIARTRVRQLFVNPSADWVEGVYVFPLPEDAAVDSLRLVVGDRIIQGIIKERHEAKRIYEKAKREGRRAGLISQERANIFTTSLANIGPGAQVSVEIEFQELLRVDKGVYALRFPTVVGPRYIPGRSPIVGIGGSGTLRNTAQVPDAERISPPVRHPDDGKINPVVFEVRIDSASPLAKIWSVSHDIASEAAAGAQIVTLKNGALPADRDFVLEWQAKAQPAAAVDLYKETVGKQTYLLAVMQPPALEAIGHERPREVVFVIDTSGSMSGTSIKGAKAALRQALGRLEPRDRFNIVQFSNDATALFNTPRQLDKTNLAQARRFVDNLTSDGGTEFLAALRLSLDGKIDNSRVRQVVFLTDGAVGNDAEVLSFIRRNLGDSRLFTIGIGAAPNSYLMRKAAEFGHGTYTFVEEESQVASRMGRLLEKLEAPAISNLHARFSGDPSAESWPKQLPDLYGGEPIMLTARLLHGEGELALIGSLANKPWGLKVPLAKARPGQGIARFWARQKIESLMDQRHEGIKEAAIRDAVLEVALNHHLVSRYTSLVAIEMELARPQDKKLISTAMATNLPHGWVFDKVFGPAPGTGTRPLLRKASFTPANSQHARLRARGATPALFHLALGFILLLLALVVWLGCRRAAA